MRKKNTKLAFSCLCALWVAAPVVAQDASAEPKDEIVVVGREVDPLREKEIAQIAGNYVDTLTVISSDEALPTYQSGVYCPAVVGLSDAINSRIEMRMRLVAEAAGVDPAGEGCMTSALVVFVDDKESFLEAFQKAHPVYFRPLREKRFRLPKEDGPAIAWHLAQLLDDNGLPISRDEGGRAWVSSYIHASNMRTMTTAVLAMSVTIVERDALAGLTTTQIADYLLMRGLTDTSPAKLEGSGAPTILTVLSSEIGDETPASLSEWDLAYVKARYSADAQDDGRKTGTAIRTAVRDAARRQAPQTRPDERVRD